MLAAELVASEMVMGFRFRKSFRIFSGVRVNLSKSGMSTSIGRPGATVNLSKRGARGTVGIPGTGISYSERLDAPGRGGQLSIGGVLVILVLGLLVVVAVLFRIFA